MELILEHNPKIVDKTKFFGDDKAICMMTPSAIGEDDYWAFRVKVSKDQAIISFPKFSTLGVGFLREKESWNTNLPCQSGFERIWEHIKKNKGDPAILDMDCLLALKMVCEASVKFLEKERENQS